MNLAMFVCEGVTRSRNRARAILAQLQAIQSGSREVGVEPTFLLPRERHMATTTMAHQAIEHEVEAQLARELPDVDLREVQVIGPADAGILRVVIDHPNGVDHALCVAATRALEGGGLRDRYAIEVWSPGPEPPLRNVAHFRDAIGQSVALRVVNEGAGRARSVSGTLTAVESDRVEVSTVDGPTWIPTSAIHRARVVERSES